MKLSQRKIISEFVAKNKSVVSLTLLSAFLSSLGSVLLPLSIGTYYEIAFGDTSGKSQLLQRFGLEIHHLHAFYLFFIGLTVLKGITSWLEIQGMRIIEERLTHHLRSMLFHAQLNHQFSAFQSKSTGKYLLRYSSDMMAIQYYLSKGIIKSVSDILFLITAFGLLISLNQRLSIALISIFTASALIMVVLSKLQEKPNEKRRNARSSAIGFIEQRLHAFATIKVFNRVHPEEIKFEKRNNELYQSAIAFHRISALNKSIPQVIFFLAIGVMLYMAAPASIGEHSAKGSLLVFILMLLYMQSAYRRLLRVPSLLNAGTTSFRNLLALLNMDHETMHAASGSKELQNHIRIDIQSLQFHFEPNKPLIQIAHAEFRQGMTYRITGASGSGKSTLLKLFLKLYHPEPGQIFVGDVDITELGAHDLRRVITAASEDYPLLGKTIFEAISYSRKASKREDVAQMLIKLGLANAQDAEQYIDRKIKSHGSDLSSGERRMLIFARALLTRKPIIVLDEPFLGLNSIHEQIIAEQLMLLKPNHLIILVSKEIPANLHIDQTIQL